MPEYLQCVSRGCGQRFRRDNLGRLTAIKKLPKHIKKPRFLEALICPSCKPSLRRPNSPRVRCSCGRRFSGIPHRAINVLRIAQQEAKNAINEFDNIE